MADPDEQPFSVTARSGAGLQPVLDRNIRELAARREREKRGAGAQDRLADAITAFVGSMIFVGVHLLILAGWVAVNVGWIPGAPAFDKTFVILATAASVEAIFLSTFVLISQNRASAAADRRADLDLQINLLAEHELTRLISLTQAIAAKVGVDPEGHADLEELARDVAPEAVMDRIEERQAGA